MSIGIAVGNGISPTFLRPKGGVDKNIIGYDTFTRANGAPGDTETIGPDGQKILARSWVTTTGVITSNELGVVPTVGSELLTNGDFTAWTGDDPDGWTVTGESLPNKEISEVGTGESHGGAGTGACNFYSNAANSPYLRQTILTQYKWYRSTFVISNATSGTLQLRDESPFSLSSPISSVSVNFTGVHLAASSTTFILPKSPTSDITMDSVSVKEINLASCIAAITNGLTRNVNAQVKVTCTGDTQAGWMLGLDSQTTPANYLHVYCNRIGNKIYVDSVTAGVVTNITSVAFVYSAGAVLECNHDGTTLTVDYNGANLITSATAMPGTGTLHGVFATDSASRFDNFLVQKV